MRLTTRRFPFITVGAMLVVIGVLPTVLTMVRAFRELQDDARQSASGTISGGVSVALNPALNLCALAGIVFIVVGVARALACSLRRDPPPVA